MCLFITDCDILTAAMIIMIPHCPEQTKGRSSIPSAGNAGNTWVHLSVHHLQTRVCAQNTTTTSGNAKHAANETRHHWQEHQHRYHEQHQASRQVDTKNCGRNHNEACCRCVCVCICVYIMFARVCVCACVHVCVVVIIHICISKAYSLHKTCNGSTF